MEMIELKNAAIRALLERGEGRALVLGGGKSGRAADARLGAHGFACTIADRRGPAGGAGWVPDDDPSVLEGMDVVVKSPGVPRDHALVREALARGVLVVGELELGWAVTRAPLHVITGSNGKSTVTALAAHVFRNAGLDAVAAGNIGEPLSAVGPDVAPDGVVALEASSFQIEDFVDFTCHAAAVLNVSPDHLDRHGDFARYLAIKLQLLDHVEPTGYRVINREDRELRNASATWMARAPERTLLFGLEPHGEQGAFLEGDVLVLSIDGKRWPIATRRDLVIDGPHNVANALAVVCLAHAAGVDVTSIATAFRTFLPLRHRLERIGRRGGVLFVNDSKATNLDALCMAVRAFDTRIVLIAGGRDKASPFEDAHELVASRVHHLVLIGEAAPRIRAAWPGVPASDASSMEEAVRVAFAHAEPEGVVLLAPGCASFDMFTGFEARGDAFRAAAEALIALEG